MDIGEFMADELNYLGDERYAKVTGLRNVKRVRSEKNFAGYSYTFEAEVNGEWLSYGPVVCGNFAVRSDCPEHTLPVTDSMWAKKETRTVWIGFYALDEYFRELPLEP